MIYRNAFISFFIIVSMLLSIIQPLYAGAGIGAVRNLKKHSIRIAPTDNFIGRFLRNDVSTLNCNIDANCAVLDQQYDIVNAQIGILFHEGNLRSNGVEISTVFFPLHGEIAV